MSNRTPIERGDLAPASHFTFTTGSGGDADSAPLDLRTFGPERCQGASMIRWEGTGAAVLWVAQLGKRQAPTLYEVGGNAPKVIAGITYYLVNFLSQGEAHVGQFTHVHHSTTTGTWSGKFA